MVADREERLSLSMEPVWQEDRRRIGFGRGAKPEVLVGCSEETRRGRKVQISRPEWAFQNQTRPKEEKAGETRV
jgi:hypothetical protein